MTKDVIEDDDLYTYIEWLAVMEHSINNIIDLEIMKASHPEHEEKPREIIQYIKEIVSKFEKQIPDNM